MYRVAVVGVGSFGRHHARHLAAHPAVSELTVVDADDARAYSIAHEHGAIATRTVGDVDAAIITVPTESHAAVAAPLLARGIHCFVEKPMAASTTEAEIMDRAARTSGATLQVGHIERFGAVFQALSKSVSDPRYIAARRLNEPRPIPPTVDVVFDLMIHDIDLVLSMVRAPVTGVDAFAFGPMPSENVQARLFFANGAIADLTASRQSPHTERTLVAHDNAAVTRADLAAGTLHRCTGSSVEDATPAKTHDNLRAELDDFFHAISVNRSPVVGGDAGLDALRLAERISASVTPSARLTA